MPIHLLDGLDVIEWVIESIHSYPENIAVECGATCLSYRELGNRVTYVAKALRAGKTRRIVAVCTSNPIEMIVSILGVFAAECVFVPLDLSLPAARIEKIVRSAHPDVYLFGAVDSSEEESKLQEIMGLARLDDRIYLRSSNAPQDPDSLLSITTESTSSSAHERRDPFCYLFHTSGSTGVPKAIAGRFDAIGHFVRWEINELGLRSGVRVSNLTSPYYDAYLRDIFVPLSVGGTICVPESRGVLLDSEELLSWIDTSAIHVLHCVPSLLRTILVAMDRSCTRKPPELRHVLVAGETLLHSDLARWFPAFGSQATLTNLYGPSETTMTKLFHRVSERDLGRSSVPIGRPMPGAAVLIIDEHGRPCPPSVPGEILIRTPFCSLGYYGQPDLTADFFLANPFSANDENGVFRTGDVGRILCDGSIELIGRRDHQVKMRGQRVDIREIENSLLSHPLIAETVVTHRMDNAGNGVLLACLVATGDISPHDLREFLGKQLPSYMIPGRFLFLSTLPRLRNGKINRKALASYDYPIDEERSRVPPDSETERRLLSIWIELMDCAGCGVTDNFFEVGGHSLLATQLLMRVRTTLGARISLGEFFVNPTIRALAELTEDRLLEQLDPVQLESILDTAGGHVPGA